MSPPDREIKNMLHRVGMQLHREEMIKGIADEFNNKFMFQQATLDPSQFAAEVERMRGTR